MRICPISFDYSKTAITKVQPKECLSKSDKEISISQVQFKAKHSGAKWGAIICGGMATAGVIAGTLLMSGGLAAIPWAAAYIGIGAGSGAIIGHSIDKGAKEFDKKQENSQK